MKGQPKGHGEKLSRKRELAILALLTSSTLAEAAIHCGVAEVTLWRWLKNDLFREHYRKARRQALELAVDRLARIAGDAVSTLENVAKDTKALPSSRVSAAKGILEIALRCVELQDIEDRVSKLEEKINRRPAL